MEARRPACFSSPPFSPPPSRSKKTKHAAPAPAPSAPAPAPRAAAAKAVAAFPALAVTQAAPAAPRLPPPFLSAAAQQPRPPALNDGALQTAADAAAATASDALPKAAAWVAAHPEVKTQVETLAATGVPGFNKTSLKLSPNDVGTLSQAAAAANTVKTFLKALPAATSELPGASTAAVPQPGVFQTAPSPTGRFTVGSPSAAMTFNTGTSPMPAPAAQAINQMLTAVTPNVEAAASFLENVVPSPPPPPPPAAGTELFAPVAQAAAAKLSGLLDGVAADAGAPRVTKVTSQPMSTSAFGRRRFLAVSAALRQPSLASLAAVEDPAPTTATPGVPVLLPAGTPGQPAMPQRPVVVAPAPAAGVVAQPAAVQQPVTTVATAPQAPTLAAPQSVPAAAEAVDPTPAAPTLPAPAAPAPAPRRTFELPRLPAPPRPAPLPLGALPPATAPTALELDAARPRPALPPAAAPNPRRADTLTTLADALGSAFVALSPSVAPALGPLPVNGKVEFKEVAPSPGSGPALPEVVVPTARAGTITLPAAALPAPGSLDLAKINPKGDLIWTNPGGGTAGGAASMAAGGGSVGAG